jgi:hypothetical protein
VQRPWNLASYWGPSPSPPLPDHLWITVNDLVGWSFFDFLSFFFAAFLDAGMCASVGE